jgi:hypothetical protein
MSATTPTISLLPRLGSEQLESLAECIALRQSRFAIDSLMMATGVPFAVSCSSNPGPEQASAHRREVAGIDHMLSDDDWLIVSVRRGSPLDDGVARRVLTFER